MPQKAENCPKIGMTQQETAMEMISLDDPVGKEPFVGRRNVVFTAPVSSRVLGFTPDVPDMESSNGKGERQLSRDEGISSRVFWLDHSERIRVPKAPSDVKSSNWSQWPHNSKGKPVYTLSITITKPFSIHPSPFWVWRLINPF